MVQELNTVEEVVDALGGNIAVAALTNTRRSNVVSNWKKRGRFPTSTYDILKAGLRRQSLTAPKSLWGMREAVHG